jgi:hypothetical protein
MHPAVRFAIALCLVAAGCGVRTPLDLGMDGSVVPNRDAGRDTGSMRCTSPAECNDGLMCNGTESCVGGRCVLGMPPACDDGISCTDDRCSEGLGCTNVPNDDRCGPGQRCTPGVGCTTTICTSDAECSDGLACNGFDVCVMGTCQSFMPPFCDDGIDCTLDACVEPSGFCTSVPDDGRCPPGNRCDAMVGCIGGMCRSPADCDDFAFCNGMEQCAPDGTCFPGRPPTCDDGIACTVDTCSEFAGGCVSTPDSSRCPMGQVCRVDGMTRGCVTLGCTSDFDCDDGSFCNGNERCIASATGRRCVPGSAISCDDMLDCTIDRCLDVVGGCVNEPRSAVEVCGNGVDDECDFAIDCADSECRGAPGCPPVCIPTEMVERTCNDTRDNDCDGSTDCLDFDCLITPICGAREMNCSNGIDDDGDGRTDCRDPDCSTAPVCRDAGPPRDAGPATGEIGVAACTNGADDDRDGRVDCFDTDCRPFGPMSECCNGIDDDGDGLEDVGTCRCFDNSTCVGVGSLDQVCWTSSYSVCLPRCNFYGGDSFCVMYAPGMPRCNAMTGECF